MHKACHQNYSVCSSLAPLAQAKDVQAEGRAGSRLHSVPLLPIREAGELVINQTENVSSKRCNLGLKVFIAVHVLVRFFHLSLDNLNHQRGDNQISC